MKNLNLIKKKLSKEDRKISVQDPSKLLAKYFNGFVIKLDEAYVYAWSILITKPLKNSANNFDGSKTDIFLSSLDSFFLIGFRFFMLIQVILVLQKSSLPIEGGAIYPRHCPNAFDLMI